MFNASGQKIIVWEKLTCVETHQNQLTLQRHVIDARLRTVSSSCKSSFLSLLEMNIGAQLVDWAPATRPARAHRKVGGWGETRWLHQWLPVQNIYLNILHTIIQLYYIAIFSCIRVKNCILNNSMTIGDCCTYTNKKYKYERWRHIEIVINIHTQQNKLHFTGKFSQADLCF